MASEKNERCFDLIQVLKTLLLTYRKAAIPSQLMRFGDSEEYRGNVRSNVTIAQSKIYVIKYRALREWSETSDWKAVKVNILVLLMIGVPETSDRGTRIQSNWMDKIYWNWLRLLLLLFLEFDLYFRSPYVYCSEAFIIR